VYIDLNKHKIQEPPPPPPPPRLVWNKVMICSLQDSRINQHVLMFILQAPEQGMKLKRLKKQVTATTGLILDSEGDQRDAFKEKVNLSS